MKQLNKLTEHLKVYNIMYLLLLIGETEYGLTASSDSVVNFRFEIRF